MRDYVRTLLITYALIKVFISKYLLAKIGGKLIQCKYFF